MSTTRTKVLSLSLAAAMVVGVASEALADKNNYSRTGITGYDRTHHYYPRHGYRRHGIGPGAAIAGAALGIAGAAAAGVAADRYYNGYPAYSYGPGYGGSYGYDYVPNHGYYGPY